VRRVFIAYPGFREFSKGGKQDGGPSGLPSSEGPGEGGESSLPQHSLGGVPLPVRGTKKFHSGPNFSLENQISGVRFSWSVFRLRSRPRLRQHLQGNGKSHARRLPPILSQLRKRISPLTLGGQGGTAGGNPLRLPASPHPRTSYPTHGRSACAALIYVQLLGLGNVKQHCLDLDLTSRIRRLNKDVPRISVGVICDGLPLLSPRRHDLVHLLSNR